MAEQYMRVRVKPGCELPTPDNGRPGQWQYDSDWYPRGGTPEKPKQLGHSWEVVPYGAAQTAQSFFIQGGECLVEAQPYEGAVGPVETKAAAITFAGRTFASAEELVQYVQQGDPDTRKREIQARVDELAKLDKQGLLNEAKIANLSAGPNSQEGTLRQKLLQAQFGEGVQIPPPTAVTGP
jgi:hypothetical protein